MFLGGNPGLGGVQVLTRESEKFFVGNSGHSLEIWKGHTLVVELK